MNLKGCFARETNGADDRSAFENAQLVDPDRQSVTHGWLRVADGVIVAQGDGPTEVAEGETVIDCGGKYLAPGIVDIGVKVCEPGERHKESYRSAGLAAAAGGVTTMVTRPDTTPAIDNPETLEFVTRRANETAPVNVLPMAALTKGREGREMTEISFLMDAGAVAFTDCDNRGAQHQGVFPRADLCAVLRCSGHPPTPRNRACPPAPRRPRANSPPCGVCLPYRPWPNAWGWTATSR